MPYTAETNVVREFQFPTGWNSTLLKELDKRYAPWFQFPTGWNSTIRPSTLKNALNLFQFPTGWNSTGFQQS